MQRCCACRAEIASWVFAEEGAVGGAGLRSHWHFECSFLFFFGLFWGGWVVWKSEWFGGGGGGGSVSG